MIRKRRLERVIRGLSLICDEAKVARGFTNVLLRDLFDAKAGDIKRALDDAAAGKERGPEDLQVILRNAIEDLNKIDVALRDTAIAFGRLAAFNCGRVRQAFEIVSARDAWKD